MSSHILLALLACVAIAAAGNPLLYKQFPIDEIQKIQPRQNEVINYRLPNNTVPESYNVQFTTLVHEGDPAFSGTVEITIAVAIPTTSIVLHHRQLTIGTITLTNVGGGNVNLAPEPYPYDPITEFLTINLAAPATPLPVGGRYILRIPFSGTLRTDQGGFYLSTYVAADNTIRLVLEEHRTSKLEIDIIKFTLSILGLWPQLNLSRPMLVMDSLATMSLHSVPVLLLPLRTTQLIPPFRTCPVQGRHSK